MSAESRNVGSRWTWGSLVEDVFTDPDGKLRQKPENKVLIIASVAKKNSICVFSAGVDASFAAEALWEEDVGAVANAIATLVDVDEV